MNSSRRFGRNRPSASGLPRLEAYGSSAVTVFGSRALWRIVVTMVFTFGTFAQGLFAVDNEVASPHSQTDTATQAMRRAEQHIQDAILHGAYWTTADDAIRRARQAAQRGSSEDVLKFATIASEQALLGIEQTRYPLVKH